MIELILIGVSLILLVIFVVMKMKSNKNIGKKEVIKEDSEVKVTKPIELGRLRIYFGSQTGTAAKLSQALAQQAKQKGFQPEIIDLKDIEYNHLKEKCQISVFLLSNTGEGQSPENSIRFMNVLRGKEALDEQKAIDWKLINYSVFGLGNTQYEHFNKIGKQVDSVLFKLGSNRLLKVWLGDDNASLEDYFIDWRKQLWPVLIKFRIKQPYMIKQDEQLKISPDLENYKSSLRTSNHCLTPNQPIFAPYKLFFPTPYDKYQPIMQQEFDFKTKASIRAKNIIIKQIKQIRQNTKDGSTWEVEIQLDVAVEYQTAGNIALYSKNDPSIVEEVIKYFKIPSERLDVKVAPEKLNPEKKIKLNFNPNSSIRNILEKSIDLQGKLTKSVLKKLGKFNSKHQNYFLINSQAKTTDQFKRITEGNQKGEWYYLFRLIKEYQVELELEDFIQLSDSMTPRLFTIASNWNVQRNVIIAASIVEKGLISKFIESNPKQLIAELRKSSFTDAMRWKKVIFVAAGTGLAPFRGYLQQKQFLVQENSKGKNHNVPIVSLYFGCKHQNGDFIYKEQILKWKQTNIINRLSLAFSRDQQKKVYVQDLLAKEQEQLAQFFANQDQAIYICGSLPMGKTISTLLSQKIGEEKYQILQKLGRIVKQLW